MRSVLVIRGLSLFPELHYRLQDRLHFRHPPAMADNVRNNQSRLNLNLRIQCWEHHSAIRSIRSMAVISGTSSIVCILSGVDVVYVNRANLHYVPC